MIDVLTAVVGQLPDVTPNFNAPGVGALRVFVSALLAIVFWAAVAGAVVGLIFLSVGHFGSNDSMRERGLKGLIWALGVAVIAGGLIPLFNWVIANVSL